MKKFLVLLIGVCTLSVLVMGCNSTQQSSGETQKKVTEANITEKKTETPTESESDPEQLFQSAEIKKEPVKSGSGDVIGERAFIEVKKEDAKNVSVESFNAFQDSVIKDAGYNYFTICFDDGTGITYAGCVLELPSYGILDNIGRVQEVKGFLAVEEGKYVLKS